MSNINVENEKNISVNITNKSNHLMSSTCIIFISLILIIFFLFEYFSSIKLFVTIFSCILVGVLFLRILFTSLCNFLTYNFRDNSKKLYKNMMLWTLIFFITIIIEAVLYSLGNDTADLLASILTIINGLIFAISLFNDGKYQGALEMYNKRLK